MAGQCHGRPEKDKIVFRGTGEQGNREEFLVLVLKKLSIQPILLHATFKEI